MGPLLDLEALGHKHPVPQSTLLPTTSDAWERRVLFFLMFSPCSSDPLRKRVFFCGALRSTPTIHLTVFSRCFHVAWCLLVWALFDGKET